MRKPDFIPGGSFLVARTLFRSAIWQKPPQYTRLLLWLVGCAAFQDGHTYKGQPLERGQLVTTYGKIADALSYRFNKKVIRPSLKEVRIMLAWLQSEGMIAVKPLISGTSPDWGRPSDLTRAYVGLLITVINYDTYQDGKLYKGKDKGRPSSAQGHFRKECINNDKDPAEVSSQIAVLKQRYTDKATIDQTLQAIATTRKTGKLADTVQLAILKAWDRYTVDQVMTGVTTYLEKDYAGQGRNERYLLGIIRNSEGTGTEGQASMKSTGSKALDDYYKNQGVFIT
jgi:hypothetical protein